MTKYYALITEDREFISMIYDDRYQETMVNLEELNVFTAQDILYEKKDDAKYNLVELQGDNYNYDINVISHVDINKIKIVEVYTKFEYMTGECK